MADITTMISELREMVDASVNPNNGAKSITGQSVNLAMHAMINAIEEAAKTGSSGGGSGSAYFLPTEWMTQGYTPDNPYQFSSEEAAAFLAALTNPSTIYAANIVQGDSGGTLVFQMLENEENVYALIAAMPMLMIESFAPPKGSMYLIAYNITVTVDGENVSAYSMQAAKIMEL